MDIRLTYQDNTDGTIYDISDIASNIMWRTDIYGQPGKLTFSLKKDKSVTYNEGSVITFNVDGLNKFYGYIFTVGSSNDDLIPITCYDQLRYLKGKDTYVFKDATLGEQMTSVFNDYGLTYEITHEPTYKLPPTVNDNKTLFDMFQAGADKTLIAVNEWYFLRDDFGTIKLLEINQLKTNLIFSEGSNLLSFNHKSSIDKDTYNYIKLIKENKDEGVREVYIVKDSESIAKWGRLQYFDKVDESANAAQIEQLADSLLLTKNRKTETMKFVALGEISLSAGDGIVIVIDDPQTQGFVAGRYYFITSCSHSFKNDEHTMSLQVEVTV